MTTQPRERIVTAEQLHDVPLHIVLVHPQIPPNTGNIARVCAATGCALHLVEPLGFSLDARELKRAGLDYWDALSIIVHPSLEAFLATEFASRAYFLSTRARQPYTHIAWQHSDVLVFGSETQGLPQKLLDDRAEQAFRIPMRPGFVRSLNLSTAVGIVTYAALAHLHFPLCV